MKKLQPEINKEDKNLIEKLLSAGHIEYKYAVRLKTILLRAKGKGTNEISEFLGIHQSTVGLYINSYNSEGIDSLLHDKTRKPGKEPISQDIKRPKFEFYPRRLIEGADNRGKKDCKKGCTIRLSKL